MEIFLTFFFITFLLLTSFVLVSASVERSSKEDLQHSLENLHSSLSHFIVNRNCFENALINKTIARIKAREMGSEDVAV